MLLTKFISFFSSLPWNTNTLIGYAGEIVFHLITGALYLHLNGVIMLLFIALCLHHRAFYQMFCQKLQKFDEKHNSNPKQFLCELIEFHILVKE